LAFNFSICTASSASASASFNFLGATTYKRKTQETKSQTDKITFHPGTYKVASLVYHVMSITGCRKITQELKTSSQTCGHNKLKEKNNIIQGLLHLQKSPPLEIFNALNANLILLISEKIERTL